MADVEFTFTAVIALIFVIAGIVKGISGMGLPIVAMGLLSTIMSPLNAALLLIVPSFLTNVWQLLAGPSFWALTSRLWSMMLGVVVGTLLGAQFLTNDNAQWTTTALGAALILYAAVSLLGRRASVPDSLEKYLSPLIGVATGLITGATGVFAIPAVPYLQALGFEKEELIQALGLSFTVSTVALAIGLTKGGAIQLASIYYSALTMVPALCGLLLGQYIRQRISATAFRRWFLICLIALGLQLALRSIY